MKAHEIRSSEFRKDYCCIWVYPQPKIRKPTALFPIWNKHRNRKPRSLYSPTQRESRRLSCRSKSIMQNASVAQMQKAYIAAHGTLPFHWFQECRCASLRILNKIQMRYWDTLAHNEKKLGPDKAIFTSIWKCSITRSFCKQQCCRARFW